MKLGKWVAVNVAAFSSYTVDDFTRSISEEFMGIHALTLLKAMGQVFRRKDGYIVETASDNTVTVLKIQRGAGKYVDGTQVLQMENTKYSVSKHYFRNEHVLEDGERDSINEKIGAVRSMIEDLTPGMVSFNTNDFVAQRACSGMRMNSAGGTYFIPDEDVPKFERYIDELQAFLGKDVVSYIRVPILKDDDGRISVAAAVKSNILSRMEDAIKKLATYSTDRGVQNRYEEVAEMLDEIDMYEEMLEVKFDDLRSKVEAARNQISMELAW